MKPFLKWVGGKQRSAESIVQTIGPVSGRYFEPFLGGGAVFLNYSNSDLPSRGVLTDTNARLINLWVSVQKHVDLVIGYLRQLPTEDWEKHYYRVREEFNQLGSGPKQAALFLWLNRAGFNGLYRENKQGEFNVPVGKYPSLRLPAESLLTIASQRLRNWKVTTGDFEEVLATARAGDTVYCDPPYVPIEETSFLDYTRDGFTWLDQVRLATTARECAERGVRVYLSNSDLPIVRDVLYPMSEGFRIIQVFQVGRTVSSDTEHRDPVSELLVRIG